MGTPIAPGSPRPAAGSRWGFRCKNAACVQTAQTTLCVQMGGRLLTPAPRSAPVRGGSQPRQCREPPSALVTQLLTKQLFLLTQQAQPPSCPAEPPCPGWHPPPALGPAHGLGGPELVRTPPHLPKTGVTPAGLGLSSGAVEARGTLPCSSGFGVPREHLGALPLKHAATSSPGAIASLPLRGDHCAGGLAEARGPLPGV